MQQPEVKPAYSEEPTTLRLEFQGMSIELQVDSIIADTDVTHSQVSWQYGFAQPLVEALRQEIRRMTAGHSRERALQLARNYVQMMGTALSDTVLSNWAEWYE